MSLWRRRNKPVKPKILPQTISKCYQAFFFLKCIICTGKYVCIKQRDGGSGGAGGVPPPPDFGRSENGGGSAGAPHYYSPPQIFRPSAIPEVACIVTL